MADNSTLPTQTLFARWRAGDAQAGQAMAQRFSDWYYALTTARLGDARGRPPLERSCVRFQQGILSVGTTNELIDWAHTIVSEEMWTAGGRVAGGDFPNAMTGGRSPVELTREVAPTLDRGVRALLAAAYDTSVPHEELVKLAEGQGGYPFAVLEARYALKRALRDAAGIPFTEVPEKPNLDAGPLPLYEGGRFAAPAEEAAFEKWVLSNLSLCKDLAEFSAFALALRAGALAALPEPPMSPRVAAEIAREVAAEAAPPPPPASPALSRIPKTYLMLALAAVGGGAVVAMLAVAWYLLR